MNKTVIRLLLFLTVAIGIGIAITCRDIFNVEMLEGWVRHFGAIGPLVFIGVYTIAAVLFLPGSIITLAGTKQQQWYIHR